MENSNQVPTAPARPGQANSAKVQLGPDSFSTPKALKARDKKQKREPIEKINPGLIEEMKHAILLNVPDLIEKRLPDTLFQRLHQPQPNVTVVDGWCLLPRVDSADDAPVTNDGQDYADTQHDLNSSTLLEQQPQASEATATAEADDGQYLQNGGLGEKPLVEDSHVASVSEKSPCVDPHPPIDLSHPSTPPSSTLSTESTTRVPDIEEIFDHARGQLPATDAELEPTGGVDGPSDSAAEDGQNMQASLNDKPERRVMRGAATQRANPVQDASDDDSSVESELDDKRKDADYCEDSDESVSEGYTSPTAGKGKQTRIYFCSLPRKRPGQDLGSSSKRPCMSSTKAKASKS
ncbi:hypothetical protein ACEPAF_2404 [Sanghuangporus sanghuang]